MPKTKIICTLGPASSSETVIRKMMLAGMDVARLNFSHGSLAEHAARIALIRSLNARYRRRIRILGDLEGHRIRIGALPGHRPIILKKHDIVWLTQEAAAGAAEAVPFDYEGPLGVIKNGQYIFIDDGTIALEVLSRAESRLKTKVIIAGVLKEHKGVNIPAAKLVFPPMTEKDAEDIRFCVREGADYIAQSFIRTAGDVLRVKERIRDERGSALVIAKIETREGIRGIDAIIDAADGIMIARGDMGVSVPLYEIPIIQKEIIRKCNRAGKPVITATQMLESMTENHIPTRAEVTDVANAIIDGTDYLMLSAESAAGRYPVESVRMMNDIAVFTERYAKGSRKPRLP